MITLYTGTPGSGKSLHVAKKIYERLTRKSSNIVIANFEINRSAVKDLQGRFYLFSNYHINPDLLYKFAVEKHKRRTDGRIIEHGLNW